MFFLLLEIHCQESDKVLLHCIESLVPLLTENKVYNTTPSDLFSISNRVWCRFGKKKVSSHYTYKNDLLISVKLGDFIARLQGLTLSCA
jgi:hypothetical protein